MGTYNVRNVGILVDSLRRSIKYAPCLELQLVWLFELLMLEYVNTNIDNFKSTVVTVILANIFTNNSKLSACASTANTLKRFRNKFCHGGIDNANIELKRILVKYKSVQELASLYDVTLLGTDQTII